jgi:dipeptidyl aminopeptidase/acylaminoacyl peptidase
MRPRTRRQLITLLAWLIGVLTFSGYIALSLLTYNVLSLPPVEYPFTTPMIPFEDVSFVARGQTYRVHAFLLQGDPGTPALISVHGRFNSRHTDYQLNRSLYLHDLGYTVLSIDLSDNGGDTVQNGRSSMGYSERWDVIGAFDFLLAQGFATDRIGLVGESMGAATVLMAADLEPRIKAVWADSPYERADTVLEEQIQHIGLPPIVIPGGMIVGWAISGERMWEVAPLDVGPHLASRNQAVYLVHDEQDRLIPYHHSVDIYQAFKKAGVDVTFWSVPDLDHVLGIVDDRAEYLERLDHFFGQYLRWEF